jgi:hypothetical protein
MLLSLNRIQTRFVTSLLTVHNTLIRHPYIMGSINSPSHRRCGAREDASAQVLCEREALVTLRHTHLSSTFLDPGDAESLGLEAIWNVIKGTELPWLGLQFMGNKGSVKNTYVHWNRKGLNPSTILFYSILFYSILFYSILFCSNCTFILYSDINMLYTSIILDIVHCLLYSKWWTKCSGSWFYSCLQMISCNYNDKHFIIIIFRMNGYVWEGLVWCSG